MIFFCLRKRDRDDDNNDARSTYTSSVCISSVCCIPLWISISVLSHFFVFLSLHFPTKTSIPKNDRLEINHFNNHSLSLNTFNNNNRISAPFSEDSNCDVVADGAICLFEGRKVLLPDAAPKGMIAHWNFDGDHVVDSSGNRNHAKDPIPSGPGLSGT